MSIEVTGPEEAELRELSDKTGRDVRLLAQEAVRHYVAFLAITDIDSGQVAEAQSALLLELSSIPDWKAGQA